MAENKLMSFLKGHLTKYLTILAKNEDYILAVPPSDLDV